MIIWAAAAGGAVLLLALALWYAPARTTVIVDTSASTARADMHLLWGMGPLLSARALPKGEAGTPLKLFYEAPRIGYALMTPGLADTVYATMQRLLALKPSLSRLSLRMNLGDSAQSRVVETAAHAAIAAAPASVRETVTIAQSEAPGAELTARFELSVSPASLNAIYGDLNNSRAVKEFRRRLRQKMKPKSGKAPREVRAT